MNINKNKRRLGTFDATAIIENSCAVLAHSYSTRAADSITCA